MLKTVIKVIDKGFNPKEYGDPLVYRFDDLFREPENFLSHFKNIPFLNGGLFECLDQKKDKDNPVEIRMDGFSTKKLKQAVLPDNLFFGEYKDIDLSQDYDDKKKNKLTVYGLIDILHQYKFTIEENTPIEEEIALDPELLGKVFENLLASYTPETQTPARKQTGSFYTPREIVNYMVDESLIAYLSQAVIARQSEAEAKQSVVEQQLRDLLSYSENPNPFNAEETHLLINAIDSCKILDPACGSGAFPMGILQKMIHILHKLDPENKIWFNMVVSNFPVYMQEDMKKRLQKENWNYVRKLGIIQQCIYGVDIQPIATQIAKLRFFISLLVDQTEKPNEPNRGIDPLPNLDFKIVTANTLISAPESDVVKIGLFENQTDPFFEEFNRLTGQYFSASMPKDKKELKNKIVKLISEKCNEKIRQIESKYESTYEWVSKALKEKHKTFIVEKEREIKLWQSYTNLFKYESVGFFEPRYFFPKATDGFDIVIANPPYLESRHPAFSDALKSAYQRNCKNRWGDDSALITKGADLLIYFFETSISLINKNGVIVLITQNAWLDTEYGIKAQKFLTNHTNVISIIDSKYRYFPAGEGPNINTVISIFHGQESTPNNIIRFYVLKNNIETIVLESKNNKNIDNEDYKLNLFSYSDHIFKQYKWGILHNSDSFLLDVINTLENKSKTIDKIPSKSRFSFGQGLNLTKSAFVPLEILHKHAIKAIDCFPILYSGSPYYIKKTEWYLVRKNRIDKSVIKKLNADGYVVFDENSTGKKPPILIMPRGISKHYCCFNSISAYSLSGVDVYASDKINIESEILNLWCFFNSSLFWLLREISGRKNLGGGLLKSEAADLSAFPVYMELNLKKENFASLFERDAMETIAEISSEDHRIIDKNVFDYLGFNEDYRNKCHEYLRNAIIFRSTRAGT